MTTDEWTPEYLAAFRDCMAPALDEMEAIDPSPAKAAPPLHTTLASLLATLDPQGMVRFIDVMPDELFKEPSFATAVIENIDRLVKARDPYKDPTPADVELAQYQRQFPRRRRDTIPVPGGGGLVGGGGGGASGGGGGAFTTSWGGSAGGAGGAGAAPGPVGGKRADMVWVDEYTAPLPEPVKTEPAKGKPPLIWKVLKEIEQQQRAQSKTKPVPFAPVPRAANRPGHGGYIK